MDEKNTDKNKEGDDGKTVPSAESVVESKDKHHQFVPYICLRMYLELADVKDANIDMETDLLVQYTYCFLHSPDERQEEFGG